MADISKIVTQSGDEYNLKDAAARAAIAELEAYTEYLGVTTTELTDGSTTNPITINGESVTAKKGEIANYGSKEFIFNGSVWQEFGDMSAIGALGYKDDATGNFTPAGTVSGTAVSADAVQTTNIVPFDSAGTLPAFSVSGETLTFSAGTLPTGGTAVAAVTDVGTLSVTDPTFTGTQGSVTVS